MTQPAGWYADPSGLPARRWWDGRQWTDHIQPGGDPTPPPNGYFPPVPPTGPAAPGPHTVTTGDPSLHAARPAASQHGGPPPPLPFTLAPPAASYTMQPVDAVSAPPGFPTPLPAAAPVPDESATWLKVAGPIVLALVAALVLVLTGLVLLN